MSNTGLTDAKFQLDCMALVNDDNDDDDVIQALFCCLITTELSDFLLRKTFLLSPRWTLLV